MHPVLGCANLRPDERSEPLRAAARVPAMQQADRTDRCLPDKRAIVAALRERLAATLERLTASQKAVQSGAVHPDNRQEGSKDMRSTEASYLARGLAERVETLRDEVRALELLRLRDFGDGDVAAAGALVTLSDEDGRELLYFLSPAGAGEQIEVEGRLVTVLTPRSPLGAAMAGRGCGEDIVAELPSGTLRAAMEHID